MVEPGDLGAASQVVALLQPLGMLGVVEEVDQEPERVLHPDDLAEPGTAPAGSRSNRQPSTA